MDKKKLRIRFEKLPNNNVYGTFEVYNKDADIILGSAEYFTIEFEGTYLKPYNWGCEFYNKLETIYKLFDLDLAKDIEKFAKKLNDGEFVEETRELS